MLKHASAHFSVAHSAIANKMCITPDHPLGWSRIPKHVMIANTVDAHVHYRHTQAEVEALAKAIVPLHDNIVAVSSPNERGNMRRILNCNYFRRRDAVGMRAMLLRAVKHSRANLQDYFPVMRETILEQAQELEEAVTAYWTQFAQDAVEAAPTH